MIIRRATRYDLDELIDMMKRYAEVSPLEVVKTNQNEVYVRKLFTAILVGAGVAWIAEQDNIPAGMIIALRNQNIWNPDIVSLNEICWWVEPEFRNGTAGYKLVKNYVDYAKDELSSGKISYWSLSKMSNSPDLDYTRFGLNKLEETHVCQQV